MADWHPLDVRDLPPGKTRPFEIGGRPLLLCHAEGAYYVIDDECPHADVPLEDGRLRGCILECPLHGGKLDVRDGSAVALPIREPTRVYAVRESGGSYEVEVPSPD